MIHLIDVDGIKQKLFLLHHIKYGSKGFCQEFGEEIEYPYGFLSYKTLLKQHISTTVIQAAVNFRIVADFIMKEYDENEGFEEIENSIEEKIDFGKFIIPDRTLTLRESCNKIIHATNTEMCWSSYEDDEDRFYWNGKYILDGEYHREEWKISLNVGEWCLAMITYFDEVSDNVDWSSLEKYSI